MAECIARGVVLYNDKRDHFVNPNLGVKEAVNRIIYGGDNTDNYTAQAITSGGEGITIDIPYTADQRGYSHSTSIKLTDYQELNDFR